jgi:GGDEF domain-containing protein
MSIDHEELKQNTLSTFTKIRGKIAELSDQENDAFIATIDDICSRLKNTENTEEIKAVASYALPSVTETSKLLKSKAAHAERQTKDLNILIEGHAALKTENTALKEKNLHLAELSVTDDLTQLPNRRGLVQLLKGELAKRQRNYAEHFGADYLAEHPEGTEKTPLSAEHKASAEATSAIAYDPNKKVVILFIDIVDFKSVNDDYHYEYGNELLKGIAQELKSKKRTGDIVGRLGGDEFVAIFNGIEKENLLKAIERFEDAVKNTTIQAMGETIFREMR